MVMVGLVSLLFRQTNIFWVAFFLGGLTFCRPVSKERDIFRFNKQPALYHIMQSSWQYGAAYDPLICEASFGGPSRPPIHHRRTTECFR